MLSNYGVLIMKKKIITKAMQVGFAVTSLMSLTHVAFASDIEIYKRGGEGSVAVMMMLDISRTMRQKLGTLDDGSSDYYGCVHSTDKQQSMTVGKLTFPVRYCTYTDDTMNFNEFFLRKKFPSYREYIKQTCDFVEIGNTLGKPEYRCYDRLTRAKIALLSLLNGNTQRQIVQLSDDKVIGLSVFPAFLLNDGKFDSQSGALRVPARRLDAQVSVTGSTAKISQRQLIINEILNTTQLSDSQDLWKKLFESDEVPIAPAYADTAAYLMGTSTSAGFRESQRVGINWVNKNNLWNYQFVQDNGVLNANSLRLCRKAGNLGNDPENWDEYGQCKWSWLDWSTQAYNPNYSDMYSTNQRLGISLTSDTATFLVNDATRKTKFSGMSYAHPSVVEHVNTSVSNQYIAPDLIKKQLDDPSFSQCHAQGIYMVTGGLSKIRDLGQGDGPSNFYIKRMMTRSLNKSQDLNNINFKSNLCADGKLKNYSGDTYTENTSWDCISDYTEHLKSGGNPTGLSIKTAVVGVGKQFADIPSVDVFESKENTVDVIEQAIADLADYKDKGSLIYTAQTRHNLKNTALTGVYGGGGWYSAMSVNEIAESFNKFVNVLSKDIPSATVNKAIIPIDQLNPYELQPYAYLSMHEPTVQKATTVWAGNLKRYGVAHGFMVAKDQKNIYSTNGSLRDAAIDYWQNSNLSQAEKLKTRLFQGGALNQFSLGKNINQDDYQRQILTTRNCTKQNDNIECAADSTLALYHLNRDYFTKDATAKDPYRGYLLALMGYDIVNPELIGQSDMLSLWEQRPELRQMGAILHSDPVLLTQEGTVTRSDDGSIDTTDRKDYVLFGTTQGLLHVINAKTGVEKFAFLPNEMVENNHAAFVNPHVDQGGAGFLYGIDAPWTVHTEYLATEENQLKVKVSDQTFGKQWAYGGLRMGGHSYYALDLTDLDKPQLKFHIFVDPNRKFLQQADPTKNRYSGVSKVMTAQGEKQYDALNYMGKSWSKPVITKVNWQGEPKLVMLVGGGYDDDAMSQNQGYEGAEYSQQNAMGAGVYMFDADTGDLLWWASSNVNKVSKNNQDKSVGQYVENMRYSVVSSIKTVDRDADGLTDHLYFGDLGGQVWRVDINNFRKSSENFATHIVRLVHHDAAAKLGKQPRFYVQPTFSIYRVPGSGMVLAALSIGSGNASSPLHEPSDTQSWVPNAVYTIFDHDVTRNNLYRLDATTLAKDVNQSDEKFVELTDAQRHEKKTFTPENYAAWTKLNGWKYHFSNSASTTTNNSTFYATLMGAKVLVDPVLMNNQLFVSVFDSAKAGTVQGCDAGIKGESAIERFCMPFGYCGGGELSQNRLYAGVGIVPMNISSHGTGTSNSRTILNSQCQGDECENSSSQASNVHKNNVLNRKLRPMNWFEHE